MPSREFLQLGNPLLWEQSLPVEDVFARENQDFVYDLRDILTSFRRSSGFGCGIAAPQIGLPRRVIFIRMQPTEFSGAVFNPNVEWFSDGGIELWDDCFSLPNLMVRVSRAASIRIAHQDERGSARTITAEGDLPELPRHELDHLDGVLAVQRAGSPTGLSTRAEWERSPRRRSANLRAGEAEYGPAGGWPARFK